MPEDFKARLQEAIKARLAGHSPQEALRIADEKMAEHAALLERIKARDLAAQPAPREADSPALRPRPEPRISQL